MSGDDTARLIYLVLLGVAVAGSLFFGNRQNLGKTLQAMLIWAMIFLGVIAVYGLWGDLRRSLIPGAARITDHQVDIPVAPDGHFYLTLQVNDRPVLFVIDTGASGIALGRQDARLIGLDPARLVYSGQSQTANGLVATARVRLDSLTLGPFRDANIPAVVIDGDLGTSLLGMDYLSRYEMTVTRDRLILRR